jgi:hypothetical protein
MPFRSRSSRTCTCARSLRNACVGACAAVHLESGQTSKRLKVGAHPIDSQYTRGLEAMDMLAHTVGGR